MNDENSELVKNGVDIRISRPRNFLQPCFFFTPALFFFYSSPERTGSHCIAFLFLFKNKSDFFFAPTNHNQIYKCFK